MYFAGPKFQWVHFYGANPEVRSGENVMIMNKYPTLASAYRGSALISTRLIKNPGKIPESVAVKPINYDIPDNYFPTKDYYSFRALVYRVADLDVNLTSSGLLSSPLYNISFTVGSRIINSSFKSFAEKNIIEFTELIQIVDLFLPIDISQLPDVFININKGSEKQYQSIAFCRVKAIHLLQHGLNAHTKWYQLLHDESAIAGKARDRGFAGTVLMKVALVNNNDIRDNASGHDWEMDKKLITVVKRICLRCFVYQARNLPSADDNGLIDPYIKIRFNGEKRKTSTKEVCCNPLYYECLEFITTIPDDESLVSDIIIECWDMNSMKNNKISMLRLPASIAPIASSTRSNVPFPKWYKLHDIVSSAFKQNSVTVAEAIQVNESSMGMFGEVLLSFQNIKILDVNAIIEVPRPFAPSCRRAYLDIYVLGLRDLRRLGKFASIQNPFLRFDVSTPDGE